jgi:hypothetical protein
MFVKRTLPALIAFVVGFFFALQYYIPHPISQQALVSTAKWYTIIAAFVFVLGMMSVAQNHARKIQIRGAGWGYSVVLFIAMIVTFVVGAICGGKTEPPPGTEAPLYGTAFGWIYKNGMEALSTTMFATLAFYVASAAFRAFRAKTLGAFLLLFFALVLLFGKAVVGIAMWDATIGTFHDALHMDTIVEWIMGTLNMSARRAILMGVALGMIAVSLKIILGIERTYLGGRGE